MQKKIIDAQNPEMEKELLKSIAPDMLKLESTRLEIQKTDDQLLTLLKERSRNNPKDWDDRRAINNADKKVKERKKKNSSNIGNVSIRGGLGIGSLAGLGIAGAAGSTIAGAGLGFLIGGAIGAFIRRSLWYGCYRNPPNLLDN